MSAICENCGKKAVSGISQRHRRGVAGKRWRKRAQEVHRLFKPNLHMATIMLASKPVKLKLCTRCIKRFKKDQKLSSQQKMASAVASLV